MSRLYKYVGFSKRTESLVSESSLWFSTPAKLNDPFECRPWFEFKYEDHQLVEGMVRHLQREDQNLTKDVALATAVGIFHEGRHRKPEMWEALRFDLIERITQDVGVLCLSATGESILMWSHYANDHTGICLGFEWSEYTPFFGMAQEVLYDAKLPTVDVFNTSHHDQVDQVFLTKFLDWRYEQEWRIIEYDTGPGSKEYPRELLKTITFGLKTTPIDQQRVREWVLRRGHEVTFQECVLDQRQFKINVRVTK